MKRVSKLFQHSASHDISNKNISPASNGGGGNNHKKSTRIPVGDFDDPERARATDASNKSPVSTFRKLKRQSSTKKIKQIVNKTFSMLSSPITGGGASSLRNQRIRARSLDRKINKRRQLSIANDGRDEVLLQQQQEQQKSAGDTSALIATLSHETDGSSSGPLKRANSSNGIIGNSNDSAALRRPSIVDMDSSGVGLAPLDLLSASTTALEKHKEEALASSGIDNNRRRTYANKDPGEPTNLSRRLAAATTAEILASLAADDEKAADDNGDPNNNKNTNNKDLDISTTTVSQLRKTDMDISTLVVGSSQRRQSDQSPKQSVIDMSGTLPVSPRRLQPLKHQASEHLQIEAEEDSDEDDNVKTADAEVVVDKDGVAAAVAELEAMRKKPTSTQKLAPSSKDTHRSKARRSSKDAKHLRHHQQKLMSDSTSKLPTMKAPRGSMKKSRRRVSVGADGRDANNRHTSASSKKDQEQQDHGLVEIASDAGSIPILPSMEDLLKSPTKLVIHSEAHGVVETTMTREQLMSPNVTKVVKRLPNGHLFISAKGGIPKVDGPDGSNTINVLDLSSPGHDISDSNNNKKLTKKKSARRRKTVGSNMNFSSGDVFNAGSERSSKAHRRATTSANQPSSQKKGRSGSTSRSNNAVAGKRRSQQQKRRVSGSHAVQKSVGLSTTLEEEVWKESRGGLKRGKSTSSINSVVLREDILKAAQANLAMATKATMLVAQAKMNASSRNVATPGIGSSKPRRRASKDSRPAASKSLRRSQTAPIEKTTSGELSSLRPSKAAHKDSSTVLTPPPPLKCISPQRKSKTPMSNRVKKRLSVADASDFGAGLPFVDPKSIKQQININSSFVTVEQVSVATPSVEPVSVGPATAAASTNRSERSRTRSKHSTHRSIDQESAEPQGTSLETGLATNAKTTRNVTADAVKVLPPRKLPARQTLQSSNTVDIFKQNYVVARSKSPKNSRRQSASSSGLKQKKLELMQNSSDSDILAAPERESMKKTGRRRAKSMSHITGDSNHTEGNASAATPLVPAEMSADDSQDSSPKSVVPSLSEISPVAPAVKSKKGKKKGSKRGSTSIDSKHRNHQSLNSIQSSPVMENPRRSGRRQERRKTLTCDGRDSFDGYEEPSVAALQRSLRLEQDSVFKSNHAVHRSTTPAASMEDMDTSYGDSTLNDVKSFATHDGKSYATQSASGTDDTSNPGYKTDTSAEVKEETDGDVIVPNPPQSQPKETESTAEMPDESSGTHMTSLEELESIREGDSLLNDVTSFATLDSPAKGKMKISKHLAEADSQKPSSKSALSDACDSVVLSKDAKDRQKEKVKKGPALPRVARRKSWGNVPISATLGNYMDKKGDFSPKVPPRRSFSFDSHHTGTHSLKSGRFASACDSVVLAQSQRDKDDDSDMFSNEGDVVARALKEKKDKIPPWQQSHDRQPHSDHTRSHSGRLSSICDSGVVPTSQRKGLWDVDDDFDMFSDAGDSVAMALKVKKDKIPPWQVAHDSPSVSGGLSSVCSSGAVPMSQRKGLWDADDDDDLFSDAGDSVAMAHKSRKAKEEQQLQKQQRQKLQKLPEEHSSSLSGGLSSVCSSNGVPISQRKGLWDVDDDHDLFSDAADSVAMANKARKAKEQLQLQKRHQRQKLQKLPEVQCGNGGPVGVARRRNSTSSINQNHLPRISADKPTMVDLSPRMPRKTTSSDMGVVAGMSQSMSSINHNPRLRASAVRPMVDQSPRMPRKSPTYQETGSPMPLSPRLGQHFSRETTSSDKLPKLPKKSNSFESAVSGLGPLPPRKTPLFALPFAESPDEEKHEPPETVTQLRVGRDGQMKLSNNRSVSASALLFSPPPSETKTSPRPTMRRPSALKRGGGGSARNLLSGQGGSERSLLRSPQFMGGSARNLGGSARNLGGSERISTRSVPKNGGKLDRSASAREVSRGRLDRSASSMVSRSRSSSSHYVFCLCFVMVMLSVVEAFSTPQNALLLMGRADTCTTKAQPVKMRQHVVLQVRPSSVLCRGASSGDNDKDDFEREFAQKQKATSSFTTKSAATIIGNKADYTQHQASVFDEMAPFFASEDAIPADVIPILEDMAAAMITRAIQLRKTRESRPARPVPEEDNGVYRILDVGCGTGALFPFYILAANAQNVTVQIQGLDLSPKMAEWARAKATKLLDTGANKKHSISVEVGDISNWKNSTEKDAPHDLVVANACFGNFWDPAQALSQMTKQLQLGSGLLCITHPLGSQFVQQLHDEDATTVPHLLPTTVAELQQLARQECVPLQVLDIVDKQKNAASYYMASATKMPFHTLPNMMRFRGIVDTGYGRGGKKLGFPTANLPSRLFQGVLQDVACGVYFGWALLEGESKGRNVPHKAVVNVGFSPTFEGQENAEKVIEAHLMLEDGALDPPDFYKETMRLQLHGFIRQEMKFPSFPDLIAQISTDVEDAKEALDLDLYTRFQQDAFLADTTGDKPWVGPSGGDEVASWEFEDMESALTKLE